MLKPEASHHLILPFTNKFVRMVLSGSRLCIGFVLVLALRLKNDKKNKPCR